MEYGIQTHNKFAFLDDDVDVSDPEEALSKKVEEAKKNAVSAALLAKKANVPAVNKSVTQKENGNVKPKEPEVEGDQAPREKKYKEWKNKKVQKNAEQVHFNTRKSAEGDDQKPYNKPVSDKNPNEKPKHGDKRSGSGGFSNFNDRGGGPRRERPRGEGNRGGPRGGGPRDNHGGGANSAEPSKRQENDSLALENEEPKETVVLENEEPKEKEAVMLENEEPKEPEVEVEQAPREKTYEEWKNEQQQKNADQIHFNTRKPGEGDDQKLYKKLVPVKNPNEKSKHEDEFDESTQHKEKREKALLIDLSFADKRSGSGGFSGFNDRGGGPRRERPRGGGGIRGGPRGGGPRENYGGGTSSAGSSKRQQSGNFMLENEQFPALGAAH